MAKNKKNSGSTVIWSLREIWAHDKLLLFILFADILVSSLSPFPNIIFAGRIVNAIADRRDIHLVVLYAALLFGLNYLLSFCGTILGKTREYRFLRLTNTITNDLNDKCMHIDFEQFNDSATLDRIHSVYRTARGNNFFTSLTIVFSSVSKAITLAGILSIMTILDLKLFIVALIVIGLQSLLQLAKVKSNRKYTLESVADQRKVAFSSDLPINVAKKKDILMYNLGGLILSKIKSYQADMLGYDKRRIRDGGIIEIVSLTLGIAFQLTSYILLGTRAFGGEISIGEFTMGIATLGNFMSATIFLVTNAINYHESFFYIKRHRSFYKIRGKFDEKATVGIGDIDLAHVKIEFKNVSFRYPNSVSYVLRNINITLESPEKLAIVGFNGAGKTSFTLLLTRMYDPTEGAIYLNGVDIRDIKYEDYLKIIATVNQDFSLLPFSVLENIAGRESVPPEEEKRIYDLLCENGMESRLQNLYKGLDTPVTKTISPAGVDFSGGETQKIAIARAIYKGAPVLILDEPTSALDPVAEYEIYQRFSEMSEGKLTIYISHRISSTRFCDRIAVFDKGEIKEYGTFDELMEQKGLYYDFFQKQAEYFR